MIPLILAAVLSVPAAPVLQGGSSLVASPGNKIGWDRPAVPVESYRIAWDGATPASVGLVFEVPVPTTLGTYRFTVQACDANGCSDPDALSANAIVTVTTTTEPPPPPPPPDDPPATVAPSAPTDLRVWGFNTDYLALGWTDTASVESAFVIERCEGAGCSQFVVVAQRAANVTGGFTDYVDRPLTPGTSYAYRVKAINSAGASAYSNVTTQATLGTAPPPPPPSDIVPVGGDVQAALNACQPGGVVKLQAGATYTGIYTFPAKAAPGCTLTSSATLPARRIAPTDAALLPIVRSGNTGTPLVLEHTANWTLDGLAVEPPINGDTAMVAIQDSTTITLDRLLLVVPSDKQIRRAIMGNGNGITLTRSHCAGVWRLGYDSQCFAAWDGAGPYTITDNFLQAASENVMFGGADSLSAERIPSDILIDGNLFTKDLAWKGQPRNLKNLLELKQARRVVIRNNVFERGWPDGQSGLAILFSTLNDTGNSPWAIVEDVLVEKNIIRDIEGLGIGISGQSWMADQPTQQGTRYTIRDNDITVTGRAFHLSNNIGVAVLENNRVQNGDVALFLNGTPRAVDDLTFRTNTFTNAAIGWDGGECVGCSTVQDALARFVGIYNGVPTSTTPPPPPPVNVCLAEPITLTVTAWPTKNKKTRADFAVFSPRGDATVTFAFAGVNSISATATDGTCSVTVTR